MMQRFFDTSEDLVLEDGDTFRVYKAGSSGPIVVLLHGAGYTSLTWSLSIDLLKENCNIIAFDCRGHGLTKTENEEDLRIDVLVQDAIRVINKSIEKYCNQSVGLVLVGHSLGGSVAVRVASSKRVPNVSGVMVIDVVEGTALSSLDHMHVILDKRPSNFDSVEAAVKWSLQSGTVRNAEAANISIPSQLKFENGSYTWRTRLSNSAIYWEGWFKGLSEQFLAVPIPKMLVLAGFDRLDTALTRGQMQGKFELRLIYGAGHVIQEDSPENFATTLIEFCQRCSPTDRKGVSNQTDLLHERLAKARSMVPQPNTYK